MAAPSRTIDSPLDSKGVKLTQPTLPGFTIGGGGGGGSTSSDSFAGIDNPEALAILMKTLGELSSGGSAATKAQKADRQAQIGSARSTLADFTKSNAFKDAGDLIAQQLRMALEKNMPAINKAVQGAGTSSASMAALLSQKLAIEAAQAAGALGAEQAKAYGGVSAQLQGILEALTRVDREDQDLLIKALEASKAQRQSSTSTTAPTNPTFSITQSGGGEQYMPLSAISAASAPVVPVAPSGYWDLYAGFPYAANQPPGTDSNGAGGNPNYQVPDPYNPYGEALSAMYENNNKDFYNWE